MELPVALHRDLVAHAKISARETAQPIADLVKLIAPMLERFIATDRGFAKARRATARRLTAKANEPSALAP
ncbi:MAG TPA: DUF2274 domain-containing protein [Nitrobacter sp.]|nr:DUF2274 domain-containing protein [Nitrobacter sp.]